MRIVVDAMGGDNAPDATVRGAIASVKTHDDLTVVLVGDESSIKALLPASVENIEVVHAPDVIDTGEEPVRAVRRKRTSSLVVGAELVSEGTAQGLVSAGNTGALMAAGLLLMGRIEGIERPALAPILPTRDGRGFLLLDAGANMDAQPGHLLQYAQMGHAYSCRVLGVSRPRVGLLNVGSEAGKGNALTKEAYALLEGGNFQFIGNVEARDLLESVCDVVVCDGFVGNALLKLLEGVSPTMFRMLREVFTANWRTKLAAAVLRKGLTRIRETLDYKEHGGAPLLGVQGACIKAHGSSNDRAIQMAIERAYRFVKGDVIGEVTAAVRAGSPE